MRHNPMYMSDYVEHLDNVLKTTGENLLQGAGIISHAQAEKLCLHSSPDVEHPELIERSSCIFLIHSE